MLLLIILQGVCGEKNATDLLGTVVKFHKTKFTLYVDIMKKLKAEINLLNHSPNKLLPVLSQDYQEAMTIVEEFIQKSNKFLDSSLVYVQDEINKLTSPTNGESIETIHLSIEKNLQQLQDVLREIQD